MNFYKAGHGVPEVLLPSQTLNARTERLGINVTFGELRVVEAGVRAFGG